MTEAERITQLESQVAALQEQLAARSVQTFSTNTSSGYYTSKYSGEEMDALLDWVAEKKAAENQAAEQQV